MTAIEPYGTLGLSAGASAAEIKRAYRRLAKQYHPDSAGERALPRFLAIQAAYEMLVGNGAVRPTTVRAGTAGRPTAPPSSTEGGASRTRASREAYRARTRGRAGGTASGSAESAESAESAGSRPGRATGTDGGANAGGTRGKGGPSAGARAGARERRRSKATIGSTSYDGADREPFDPAWEGASWYGAGSGTYWTINPKEYADPRKHGPEYLARSRRAMPDADAAPWVPPADDSARADQPPTDPAGSSPDPRSHPPEPQPEPNSEPHPEPRPEPNFESQPEPHLEHPPEPTSGRVRTALDRLRVGPLRRPAGSGRRRPRVG